MIEDILTSKSKDDALAGGVFTGSAVCASTGETPSAVAASATLKPARVTPLIANMVMCSSSSDLTAPRLIGYRAVEPRLHFQVPPKLHVPVVAVQGP